MKTIIALHKEQEFLNNLKKLQKFAINNGLKPVEIISRKEVIKEVEVANIIVEDRAHYQGSDFYPLECLEIEIEGDIPSFNGWTIKAEVFIKDDVLACSDDDFLPEEMFCEHCETNRKRNKTFILMNQHGTIKQIASSCVKHFVGVDLGQFFSHVQLFKTSVEVIPEMMEVGDFKNDLDYCSDRVYNVLTKHTDFNKEEIIDIWKKQNDSIINFFLTFEGLPSKKFRDKLYEPVFKAQTEKNKETKHFGEINKRYTLELFNVQCTMELEDKWTGETKYKYTAKTIEGCNFEFYHKERLEVDINVKATVKQHKTFHEKRITYINRVSLV
jgi:hypothetical protein